MPTVADKSFVVPRAAQFHGGPLWRKKVINNAGSGPIEE